MKRTGTAIFVTVFLSACAGRAIAEDRILIVGDSWAWSISTVGYDGPGFGSFDAVLAANGFPDITTRGDLTARGGRSAEFWDANKATIVSELVNHPAIDLVHLITGGIDFLNNARDYDLHNATVRAALFSAARTHIENIVDACLNVRPGAIKVVLADYDYLDATLAGLTLGSSFHGATQQEFNEWMVELGQLKRDIAASRAGCYYVQNWGTLQSAYAAPAGYPYPGGPPDFNPYPGGDIAAGMPAGAHVGDGIHPTDQSHRYLLQNAMDWYYTAWLDTTAPVITLDPAETSYTVKVGGLFVAPTATAVDSRDGDISDQIVVTGGPVDTSTPGIYTLHYTATDSADNAAEVILTVIVAAQMPALGLFGLTLLFGFTGAAGTRALLRRHHKR